MALELSREREMIMEMVRKVVVQKIAPRVEEIDRTAQFPQDLKETFRKTGFLGFPIEARYGGGGLDHLTCCATLEEIGKTCGNSGHLLVVHWLGCTPLRLFGSEEQKERYFPLMVDKLAAFSLTEPGAGSDAGGLRTKATRERDESCSRRQMFLQRRKHVRFHHRLCEDQPWPRNERHQRHPRREGDSRSKHRQG